MNRKLLPLLCGVLIFGAAGICHADSFTFNLDLKYSGTDPAGSKPWLSATFLDIQPEQNSPYSRVQLTMAAIGLSGSEFVSHWLFNTSFENTLVFSYQINLSTTGPDTAQNPNPTASTNNENAGSALGFDIDFAFPTANSPAGIRFEKNETVVYYIEGLGLKASDFAAVNDGGNGYYSAAHVQSIGANNNSGWIASNSIDSPPVPNPVPEPAAMILLGLGLIGVAVIGRRVH